jgi:2-keto-4-pentenoate hydratase/2-oxohepta-3-ene-1,7-dioic acid hydratase in catechol pathway
MNADVPREPKLFIKPSTAVIGPNQNIEYPSISEKVDAEGELAIIIGKQARNVSKADAKNYILGYTCLNDVTARDIQRRDEQWTRGKGFDTFCPIGPYIATNLDPTALTITTRVNGEVRQEASTSDMVFGVEELVAFVSEVMTLLPGDIIATGTPAGVPTLNRGDQIEIEISEIGTLSNFVA